MKQIRMFSSDGNILNLEESVNEFLKELSRKNAIDIDIQFSICKKLARGVERAIKYVMIVYEIDNK